MKEMCQLLYLALISSKPLIAIYTVAQSIQKIFSFIKHKKCNKCHDIRLKRIVTVFVYILKPSCTTVPGRAAPPPFR